MTEENLVRLVKQIRTASGCIVDLDGLIEKFERHVKDASASQLIFDSPSGRMLTAEEVVEQAMRPKT